MVASWRSSRRMNACSAEQRPGDVIGRYFQEAPPSEKQGGRKTAPSYRAWQLQQPVNFAGSLKCPFTGYPLALARAVDNLLDNALRYGSHCGGLGAGIALPLTVHAPAP